MAGTPCGAVPGTLCRQHDASSLCSNSTVSTEEGMLQCICTKSRPAPNSPAVLHSVKKFQADAEGAIIIHCSTLREHFWPLTTIAYGWFEHGPTLQCQLTSQHHPRPPTALPTNRCPDQPFPNPGGGDPHTSPCHQCLVKCAATHVTAQARSHMYTHSTW